ncbi:MAG: CoA-binding protein, partial [Solirubrobacterales bacterium]
MSILLDADFTFLVQGITGREAVNLTRECLDFGSKIVAGVTPGRKGREVHGVPVFDTVEQAVAHNGRPIDGAVATVPPAFTKDAVFEAIENGVGLIVIVTERIPRRDVAEMVELADLHGARIIGPNCLGLIAPGVAKMGGIGGPAKDAAKAYVPGPVGVMSRSGGMTTEISSTLTAAGLGVSTAVSIGGDAIIGSTYADLMPLFEADDQTETVRADDPGVMKIREFDHLGHVAAGDALGDDDQQLDAVGDRFDDRILCEARGHGDDRTVDRAAVVLDCLSDGVEHRHAVDLAAETAGG